MIDQRLSERVRKLQAVLILAGDIVPTNEKTYLHLGWRSARELEKDSTGPTFSYERVLAAAALYRMNSSLVLIPSGGHTNIAGKQSATIAEVISFELTQLGVPQRAIIQEPLAFNTQQQLVYCAATVRKHGWPTEGVAILAPCWQFGRICAMLAQMLDVKPLTLGVTPLISMERVLFAEDVGWKTRFTEWYELPEVREVFAKEILGTGQLWTGHQPKYPNPFRGFTDPLDR